MRIATVDDVVDAIRRDYDPSASNRSLGRTVFMIGAGCSKSAGIPLSEEIAKALVRRLAKRYGVTSGRSDDSVDLLHGLVEQSKFPKNLLETDSRDKKIDWYAVYDVIFRDHYRTPKEIQRVFSSILDASGNQINWAHVCLGELVRLGYTSTVLTTNFDQLALDGISRSGSLPVVADGVGSLHRITGDPAHPQLIHIHGSRHTYYLRNTSEDIDRAAKDLSAIHAISDIYRSASIFIVIGYGGREKGLMELLTSAGVRWPDTQIYWVSHAQDGGDLSDYAKKFVGTSRYSYVVPNQDADVFFDKLVTALTDGGPLIVRNPMSPIRDLADRLQFYKDEHIINQVSDLNARVLNIQISSIGSDIGSNRVAEAGTFLETLPMAVATLDRDGRITVTNSRFSTLIGDQLAGGSGERLLIEVVRQDDRTSLSRAIESAKEGKDEIAPLDLVLAGPKERSARFFVNAVAEDRHAAGGIIVYALDTTDQRALEEQFAQSQKMQAVGQLAGGVAHDFNNVLTAIIGYADLLLANHEPQDASFQDIMNIKQNANRAAGLVRQLLAFSRRQTLHPRVLQLAETLSDVSHLLQRLLGEKIELRIIHARDLWPIKADVNQLEQVSINLAVNARDAMPNGGQLSIRTSNIPEAQSRKSGHSGLPAADYVLIEFEDNGVGIAPEYHSRIFEPFFSTKEVGKGTGLGLSTVYGIVQQTGGHIFFESEVGRGTRFEIYLPRYAQDDKAMEEAAAKKVEEPADLTGSGRILLVEDEEAVRAFGARALTSRGYTVEMAANGVEALQIVSSASTKFDLVVSDVVMPEMDGPTLLRQLRATQPDLKFIFISGYAEDSFKKNFPASETYTFLPKPFSLKQLAAAVKLELAGD